MIHSILLITADPLLATRVTQALPSTLPVQLQVATGWLPAPQPRGWLLVLLDACISATLEPPPSPFPPALWLGQHPHLAAGARRAWPGPIADFIDRQTTPTTLAFVLHQHLNAAYLLRMRRADAHASRMLTPLADPGERQRRINNALTGLLGNAELARAAHRRLAPPLARRLQNIAELTSELRDLLDIAA